LTSGIKVKFVNVLDLDAIAAAIDENTKVRVRLCGPGRGAAACAATYASS
jgi:hypothetical protein